MTGAEYKKEQSALFAVSPIDGRYVSKTNVLTSYFSEFAFIQRRVQVEIEYFILLCEIPLLPLKDFPRDHFAFLRSLYQSFTAEDAQRIKEIEQVTNHDVKAVEYWIKEKMDEKKLFDFKEFVHFGLTSQDINNTAYPMCIKASVEEVFIPIFQQILEKINALAEEHGSISMLAHTHGQPASPTTLGKEWAVFGKRLDNQFQKLLTYTFSGKLGGATGNLNAHYAVYPEIAWEQVLSGFMESKLGLIRQYPTTQIEHYDGLAELCHLFIRMNSICIDLCRDLWTYISMDYFKQKINPNEVGSSAMPHKVNPIDFENAEGNLMYANAIFDFLAQKLPVSRLQRDLTDSTVLRNFGVPLAHTLIASQSILKGLSKIFVNPDQISSDLENNWAVVAEAIQSYLRSIHYPNPYETLKQLTRSNQSINKQTIHQFIDGLSISDVDKIKLQAIEPSNYIGKFTPDEGNQILKPSFKE